MLRYGFDKRLFNVMGYIFIGSLALLCVLPMYLIITGSVSANDIVMKQGFSLWPKRFSFDAYRLAFSNPSDMFNAYRVTMTVTLIGTMLLVLFCSMAGYVLSRKDYTYRNLIAFYIFFTTMFGGGLVPWYILCVRYLGFKQHPILALILPGLFSFFYIIIYRSYVNNIPDSISESAKMDGANDFVILYRIIYPMSKPVLATIALFGALGFWNDWFNCMLFIGDKNNYNLQYYLYSTLNSVAPMKAVIAGSNLNMGIPPTQTFKLAMTVITVGPILFLYPFLQRFFIKGLVIGAVKG